MEQPIVSGIVGVVSDVLRRHNVQIPDENRGDSTEPIVGCAYAELHSALHEYLKGADMLPADMPAPKRSFPQPTGLEDMRPFYMKAPMVLALAKGIKTSHRIPAAWRMEAPYARRVGIPSDATFRGMQNDDYVWETARHNLIRIHKPFSLGDTFYVRESVTPVLALMSTYEFGEVVDVEEHPGWKYDDGDLLFPDGFKPLNDEFHITEIRANGKKKSPTEMPKAACRRVICVNDIRVEHLHDITDDEIIGEGVPIEYPYDALFCRRCGGSGIYRHQRKAEPCTACSTLRARYENFWNNSLVSKERGALSVLEWKWNPWVIRIGFDVYRRFYKMDADGNGVPNLLPVDLKE